MDSGSSRRRVFWRGMALAFAVSVVTVRLGIAGCSPALSGPTQAGTKAGGGFNGAQEAPPPPASGAAPPGAKPPAGPAPVIREPAFFPPTKAGGGFYGTPSPANTGAPSSAAPRRAAQAPTQQAPSPEAR